MRIIVVGAGIVGVSCAIWLQRGGHDVTIVDSKGPASGTSHGNAGVLAAGAVIPVTTPGLAMKAPGMLFDPNAPLHRVVNRTPNARYSIPVFFDPHTETIVDPVDLGVSQADSLHAPVKAGEHIAGRNKKSFSQYKK